VNADCGCVLDEGHEPGAHHVIPRDGAPHAPSSECGCGPARFVSPGNVAVYAHPGGWDDRPVAPR
jgi:hypothetical protein